MRTIYKALLVGAALSSLIACEQKAVINGEIADTPNGEIIVRQLEINSYNTLDTLKTDASGRFSYKIEIAEAQPEFIYLFRGETRIAALLLERGDKVNVKADSLGNYSVSGSESSIKLAEVDKAYTQFNQDLIAARENNSELSKIYLNHYRECVKYILANPKSLTTIPVLYETLGIGGSTIFTQNTDAIIFRNTADSLMTVYPDSRYVKALDKEAKRRMNILQLDHMLRSANELNYPEINISDINGEKKALSEVDAKVILLHYWDAADAAQKMMNIEILLPLYNEYHKRGFEIYSICTSTDKAYWGSVVSTQKLPWINVCDGLGAASPAISLYGVTSLPNSILIVDGKLSDTTIKGEEGLRKELGKLLRP